MATGRVGGTKSKISGKVGSEVYTVRKDSQGSYEQVVAPMPEGRQDVLTPEVVEQRIAMSICYRYMAAIPQILNNAFKDDESKSLNLQEFVRLNIPILREKIRTLFDNINPVWFYDYGDTNLYPAPIQIGGQGHTYAPGWSWQHGYTNGKWYLNAELSAIAKGSTLRQYMSRHALQVGDIFVLLIQLVDDDPSLNDIYMMRLTFNPKISLDTEITPDNYLALWDIWTQVDFIFNTEESYGGYSTYYRFVFTQDTCFNRADAAGFGDIFSGKRNGKWVRNQCYMHTIKPFNHTSHLYKRLSDVWDSWYTNRLNV